MKVKLLIKLLQEADPSGELEVSCGNTDILYVDNLPSYYDGCQKLLIRDDPANPYKITHGLVRGSGRKVIIKDLDYEWHFIDRPDMRVEYDGEYSKKRCEEDVEKWRTEAKKIIKECDEEMDKK